METAEWNTGKQFSAKETALRKVYKDSLLLLLLLLLYIYIFYGVNTEKQSRENGIKAFQGCNGSGLERYLR